MDKNKGQFLSGTIWSLTGQLISLALNLVVIIWLARLLSPDEFGTMGVIMFFISISNVLVESGFGGALIRKKNPSKEDYSTVFLFNLFISCVAVLFLILVSTNIANFYQKEIIKPILIVSSSILIINAFRVVQNAKMVKDLAFKKQSTYRIASTLFSSVMAIIFAYLGFGIWSLVIMQILNSLINTVLISLNVEWDFGLKFSSKSMKELSKFGVNTTISSLISVGFDNVYQLVLGKSFSIAQTGLYHQAKRIQDVPGGIINNLSQGVVFSILSRYQEDKTSFIVIYNRISTLFIYLLGFSTLIFFLYAKEIILLLFGEKWIDATIYLALISLSSFFYYIELINRVILKVFNKTNIILNIEFLKRPIQAVGIFIGVYNKNIEILLILFVITSAISYFVNYYYTTKSTKLSGRIELKSVFYIIFTIFICSIVFYYISNILVLKVYYNLFYIPVLFILYSFMLQVLGVLNLTKELKFILPLLKSR